MARKGRKVKKADATPRLGQLMEEMLRELERRDAAKERESIAGKR